MPEVLPASIIIPTYNRAAYLSECLKAVAALKTDPATFEIIIVDNNSPDNTQDVSSKFAQAHPMLQTKYILETRQGLGYGRNRGVIEAKGNILCFLDDDALPYPEWLSVILSEFRDPTIGCFGGPALLNYQGQERPKWLKGDLQGLLSGYVLPYTKPTLVSKVAEFPFGCNMAFRKEVFNELGFFRTDLDRSGNQVLAAGDTEMIARAHKTGWKVMYLPEAQVSHLVAPERLKKEYIYLIGRGLAQSHVLITEDSRPRVIFRWFVSDSWYTTRMFLSFILSFIRGNPLWFDDYMRFWMVGMRIPLRVKSLIKEGRR